MDSSAGTGAGSAVDQVVTGIRSYISEQGLSVGDRLPTERELCERYSAGRNTVREAMRILKAYGMVEVRPKVGATISDNRMARAFELFAFNTMEVSRKTFSDVQAFRDLLEVGSAEILLERICDDDIAEMRMINAELATVQDLHDASEIDFRFHVRLISILDNAAMLDVYTVMKPVILRIMEKGKTRRTFRTDTLAEHEGVVDALEARDRLAFQYKLRSHLNFGFRHFREEMEVA
ncbi:FCD domain-containing protein [Hoeflea sp. CAU 1731]